MSVCAMPQLVALWYDFFLFLFLRFFFLSFFFYSLQDPIIAPVIHSLHNPGTGCSSMCFCACGGSVTHTEWKSEVDES